VPPPKVLLHTASGTVAALGAIAVEVSNQAVAGDFLAVAITAGKTNGPIQDIQPDTGYEIHHTGWAAFKVLEAGQIPSSITVIMLNAGTYTLHTAVVRLGV
jgi:hypothetical protein